MSYITFVHFKLLSVSKDMAQNVSGNYYLFVATKQAYSNV